MTRCMPLPVSKQLIISEKTSTAQTQIQTDVLWCKPLTFTCKTTDFLSQRSQHDSCTCMCTHHMQAPVNMHSNAAPRHASNKASGKSNNQTPEGKRHLEIILKTKVDASLCLYSCDVSMYQTANRTEDCLPLQCALAPLETRDLHGRGSVWREQRRSTFCLKDTHTAPVTNQ